MCLAVPAEIVEFLPDAMARVSIAGVGKMVSVALLDGLEIGDYVIVHAGFALSRIDPDEARETLALFADMQVDPSRLTH
ncbi:HypC/HybG/HupF family hydrogenase formation chaperone [Burkholderia multivorans]|uniref:HypC/HybG/HupF family hydrogenase formation chaperone n=1 Tax=Burkholderia multivorans TaxID=87883 RepID=UPI000CFE5270|nr:HypC/HybG/HupF family hydrogenase formation chaperone [Burkholderia multivorans]PRH18937.1 HypC/HybG/HupF family hydrogenase formation chaperone [Burkholderia multivorans]